MRILVTMPGRFGDILWSLPTVRALAEANGAPVDFATSAKYSSILPLIKQQEYIREAFVWPDWNVQESAPMTPWDPGIEDPGDYNQIVHLGYRAWPDRPLPQCIYEQTKREYPDLKMAPLDLERPWITLPPATSAFLARGDPRARAFPPCAYIVGFTDEWFELKYGLSLLLWRTRTGADNSPDISHRWIIPPGGRWSAAGWTDTDTWEHAAYGIAAARLFLGDCSALHVLACAVGTPCVLMEPAEARWNPIFYPYGMDGPRVTVVRGNDGRPTFDSRHVRDAIKAKLEELA